MSTNKQLEVLAKLGVDTLTEDEYEVQEHTLCDGWINTWTTYDDDDNEIPSRFRSEEDAESSLEDFFRQCRTAVKKREMEDVPDPDDFRIVKVA